MVAVSHIACTYVDAKYGRCWRSAPWDVGAWLTPWKHNRLHVLRAEFGRSRSNGTTVIREIRRKMWPSRPAFQGHSRSLEPIERTGYDELYISTNIYRPAFQDHSRSSKVTRIDQVLMSSY